MGSIKMWSTSLLILHALLPGILCREPGKCALQVPFTSNFTTPYYDQVSEVWGCLSKTVSTSGGEIHVINIREVEENEITLDLLPRQLTGIHSKPLTFVLNTPKAVSWKIQGHRISDSVQHLFVLPRGSLISATTLQGEVISKRKLPFANIEQLLRWTKKNYGVVTSVLDARKGNVIKYKIGVESEWPDECHPSQTYDGASVVTRSKKLTFGCDIPENTGEKAIHILQVENTQPEMTIEATDVTVILNPGRGAPVPRHVILILQTRQPVRWHLLADKYTGILEVVTHGQVNSDRDIVGYALGTRNKGLQLVAEITRTYGAPASFVSATLANRLSIDLAPLGSSGHINSGNNLRTRMQPSNQPTETEEGLKAFLQRAMTVQCLNTEIRVSLQKIFLQLYDLKSITFTDTSCQATQNETHYVLQTKLNGCGTHAKRLPAGMNYINKIFVKQDDDYASGNHGDGDESSGNGSGYDVTTDDEDLTVSGGLTSLVVQCEYSTPGTPIRDGLENSAVPSKNGIQYKVELHKFESFSRPILQFPSTVGDGQRIYVETSTVSDSGLGVVTKNCWLSPSSSRNGTKHWLITGGCKTEDSLLWHGARSRTVQRFSFVISNLFQMEGFIFLHCELTTCSTRGRQRNINRCIDQDSYCIQQHTSISAKNQVDPNIGRVYTGPVVIMQGISQPEGNSDNSDGEDFFNSMRGTKNNNPPNIDPEDQNQGTTVQTQDGDISKNKQRGMVVQGLNTATVIGIAFASFIIGVLLTAALWFIHNRTKPMQRHVPERGNRESPESSGECTPNSLAPISVRS